MRFASPVNGLSRVLPGGQSYDIDRFGMIVSSKEEGSDADLT